MKRKITSDDESDDSDSSNEAYQIAKKKIEAKKKQRTISSSSNSDSEESDQSDKEETKKQIKPVKQIHKMASAQNPINQSQSKKTNQQDKIQIPVSKSLSKSPKPQPNLSQSAHNRDISQEIKEVDQQIRKKSRILSDGSKEEKEPDIFEQLKATGMDQDDGTDEQDDDENLSNLLDDDEDDQEVNEQEKQQILDDLMNEKESDSDDSNELDEDSSNDDKDLNKEIDSERFLSNVNEDKDDSVNNEEIANRSLDSEGQGDVTQQIVDYQNYFRYVSEKYFQQKDILEVIDRNERNFKQTAESLIQKSSQLIQNNREEQQVKKLMIFTPFDQIAHYFHGDIRVSQGVPYSLAALEKFIGIGSSDGSVRLFDETEKELKVITDKSVKNSAVSCIDMKRIKNDNIFVVTGHVKGQIALYELKGLKRNEEVGQFQVKHHKTMTDVHNSQVVQIKFFGVLGSALQRFQTVSCDFNCVVYLCVYQEGMVGYKCVKQCLLKKRISPAFSIAPLLLFDQSAQPDSEENDLIDPEVNLKEEFSKSKQNEIVGLGALDKILVVQVKPKAMELMSISKPDYIEVGTVPYLDWGEGLSPSYRDKNYPILAIAWGKIIQLVVYTNYYTKKASDKPELEYDGFYICDGFTIDQCYFLGDSILFIIVNKKEVRILYTQNFTPGIYDQQLIEGGKPSGQVDTKKAFMNLKEKYSGQVSQYAEKDKGYNLLQDDIRHKDIMTDKIWQRSKYNFNPTVRKNEKNIIVALGKGTVGRAKLLHWKEYLELIRKTYPNDWLRVLRAALDIYSGKMMGLSGLPDQQENREQLLRDRMKDLLRKNIKTCVKEFQEGKKVSNKTLRVALEFCIRVGAIDHLFSELFQMFAEEGMEQQFFLNLEPFILSGKFRNTRIPPVVLGRMMEYYRRKDTELLEKALLNVDLTSCQNILEVRHVCETEYLTSALIHLLTNLFDKENENTVCLQLLCTLFNLILRSKEVIDKNELYSLMDKNSSQEEEKNEQRKKIQNTQTYIGYKLLWVIKLFLEGKKFPSGQLSSFKWQTYIFDIEYLKWFLLFDPDCFFKLLKILFLEQEPFSYLTTQRAFIEMFGDQFRGGIDPCMSHSEILKAVYKEVQNFIFKEKEDDAKQALTEITKEQQVDLSSKSEQVLNSFIFFVAQISKRQKIEISQQLCVFVVLETLKFYQKLVKIPNIHDEIQNLVIQQPKQLSIQDKKSQIYHCLIKKNEKDILNLIKRCEEELSDLDINAMLLEAEISPLYKVRVYFHQLLGNYSKCLSMFFDIEAIKEDVFKWLDDIQYNMNKDREVMKQLILKNIDKFVSMNPQSTIKLCSHWFDNDHMQLVDELKSNHQLIFNYITAVLATKEDYIQNEFNQILLSGGKLISRSYNLYKELMMRFVRILCQKKFRGHLVEYVKKKYFPINECLEICQELKQKEACGVLYKRQGEYKKSIQCYLETLIDLCASQIIQQLIINANREFNDPNNKNEYIKKFDQLILDVIKVCEKYGGKLPEKETEALWLYSINGLYQIRLHVYKKVKIKKEDKSNLTTFLMIRTQYFMKRMSEYVNMRKIIQFLEDIGQPIKYQQFKQTFEDKVKAEHYSENIMTNAKALVLKDLIADTAIITNIYSKGSYVEKEKCDYCKRALVSKWDSQDCLVFSCQHIYHSRCALKFNNQCHLCFTEFEEIQNLINQRGIRRIKNQSISSSNIDIDSQITRSSSDKRSSKSPSQDRSRKVINLQSQPKNEMDSQVLKALSRFDNMNKEKSLILENF